MAPTEDTVITSIFYSFIQFLHSVPFNFLVLFNENTNTVLFIKLNQHNDKIYYPCKSHIEIKNLFSMRDMAQS